VEGGGGYEENDKDRIIKGMIFFAYFSPCLWLSLLRRRIKLIGPMFWKYFRVWAIVLELEQMEFKELNGNPINELDVKGTVA